jgi:hypothetical protein
VTILSILIASQISVGAIVARVKENEAKIHDLQATTRLTIAVEGETRHRVFEFSFLRQEETFGYRARIELLEPPEMEGTEFLIHAERGKRNREWAYFPDLGLVREIAGKGEDDPFLGSDITYADLAGGAHLDDLTHRLLREEAVNGEPCYVLEGTGERSIPFRRAGRRRGSSPRPSDRDAPSVAEPKNGAHARERESEPGPRREHVRAGIARDARTAMT